MTLLVATESSTVKLVSKFLVFGFVAVALLAAFMSSTAVAVAFPQIASGFNVPIVLAGWVLSANLLATVVSAPLAGKACDSFGRKQTFVFLVTLFTVASFLCALAPNIYWLIFFRVAQGIGTGGIVSSATGIVARAFPESRQRAIGLITTINTFGLILGPNVGGWLVESFGWRSVFWFVLPLGIAALIAAMLFMKRDVKLQQANLDVKGAGLLAGSLAAVMVGTTIVGKGEAEPISWFAAGAMVALGVAMMAGFLRVETRAEVPLINMQILYSRPFMAANVFNIVQGVSSGVMTLVPFYAVTVHGMSTLGSGLALTPRSVGMSLASLMSSLLIVHWGYRKPLLTGASLVALALFLLGLWSGGRELPGFRLDTTTTLLALVGLSGIGAGLYSPAVNNACIELLPDEVSTITGVRQAFGYAGSAFGVAIATIILQGAGTPAGGFELIFIGAALLFIIALPSIFAMPRSPVGLR